MAGAIISLICIWVVSIIVSLPNFIWRKLETHQIKFPEVVYISFCFEDWPNNQGRFIYSTVVMILQYVIPIFTMTLAYCMICCRVQRRMKAKKSKQTKNYTGKQFQMSNTTKLLLSITLIYCISWFPLNMFNVSVDLNNPFGDDHELMLIIYALCHMVGMSSSCSNPLLYGWLNRNFRKEFYEMFDVLFPCCRCSKKTISMEAETERGFSRVTQAEGQKISLKPIKIKKKKRKEPPRDATTAEGLQEELCSIVKEGDELSNRDPHTTTVL
ncbi:UNVERIFIED_CONTAM: hypothetical protein GTU68_020801 [Idotea baltica]|nr:hypothetical protein [Idotea baltica]